MTRKPAQRFGQRFISQAGGKGVQRRGRRFIQLFHWGFCGLCRRRSGLHPHLYYSKFPPLPGKFVQNIGRSLT
jgi:hypothetical protein